MDVSSGALVVPVAPSKDFRVGSRHLIKAGVRNIAVFHLRSGYYAIDNACYHHGGPLVSGDLENLAGHPCVICPWHNYRIALDTGEGFFWAVENGSRSIKSKGRRQRTHRVEERDGMIVCVVEVKDGDLESDRYAGMALANQEFPGPVSPAAAALARSGMVLHARTDGAMGACSIQCKQVTPVSLDKQMMTFTMSPQPTPVRGADFSERLDAGMWVELELPEPPRLRRQWTVTRSAENRWCTTGWFDITVKRRHRRVEGARDPERSASERLFGITAGEGLKLLRTGGTFTVQALRPRIALRRGRLVMISAGIGVTPIYASLQRYLNDSFTRECGPPLHVLHIHVDRRFQCIPFVPDFEEWHATFTGGALSCPVTYSCHFFLTAEELQSVAYVGAIPISEGRPTKSGITQAITLALGTLDNIYMLCGPTTFMGYVQEALTGSGVDERDIEQEDFE